MTRVVRLQFRAWQRGLVAAERMLGVHPRPVLRLLNYARGVRLVEARW